jgi:tetratricopeptide (TPR) repeat protein
MHTIRIEFQESSGNENRLRLFNEDGHLVDDRILESSTIEATIERAEEEYGQTSSESSVALGQALYDLLDGPTRWVAREREASRKALQIRIDVQGRLAHLPLELLSDQGDFLCSFVHGGILPIRQVGQEKQPSAIQDRPLRLLFMACDPMDGGPSLDYEAEETRILEATRKSQLDLEVEESGSLSGLKERLDDFGEDYFDVFHLTGHAQMTDQGPVFAMETDEGYLHIVTPKKMQEAFGDPWPRLIFLSGCETGKTQDAGASPSFCEALVRVGAPAVLGWALPVFDDVAIRAAKEIYEDLSAGKSIDDTVLKTRAALYGFEERHKRLGIRANWHLLRLYSDGTSLDPLVTPRRSKGRAKLSPRPPSTQVFLDAHAKKEVCPRDRFVGRRRPLQQGIRTLRAQVGDDDHAEGLLIHGMGGLGKSSLAARLCDRLRRRRLVLVGWLDEPELLRNLSEHLREPAWIDVLQDPRLPLQTRLERVLEEPLHQDPVLFVLDDFEQNLERKGETLSLDSAGLPQLQPAPLAALTALLRGIRETGSDSRLLITCRYRFTLPERTRVKSLELHHFHGPELTKKLAQLEDLGEQIAHSQVLKKRVLELAGGNPRLLERLDRVVAESEIEPGEILQAMESVTEDFREETLLGVLLEQLSATCRTLLARLSLLRLPVAWSSVETLSEIAEPGQHLDRAGALGLIEIARRVKLEDSSVFVSTLVGPLLEKVMNPDKTPEIQAGASRHLYQEWGQDSSERSEVRALEVLRLALAGHEQEIAARICADLAHVWFGQARFREADALCQLVSAQFEDYRVLMAQARSEVVLGKTEKALGHYEKALELAPPEKERDQDSSATFSATLHNMAGIVAQQGDIPRAMKLWEQSLEIEDSIGNEWLFDRSILASSA